MKTISKLFAALVIFTFASVTVNAQNVAEAESEAAATIVTPISIANTVGLNFGNVAAGSAAGTVVLSPAGVRTESNVILPSIPGTVSAASFTVTGLSGATYVLTLPTSATITAGSNNMTINAFTDNASEVLTGGTETFQVGATLNVDADQPAGIYEGTFDVTVDYN